ncbi:LysE family translocator [Plantactinospora sp. KBS50]|uniref:LysE family translocator n=1 Tax=Plantactinospora sp. KBS50 TaxID=2024580 RepID=UPI000BAAC8B2|nr:LysE family translocator [Plantactinospora sp. KBS50]ASW53773.1 lysine transporter LysE [Plantactinospora sp. KBS50]
MSISFLLTSLIVVVTPGTGVIYTMAAGLSRGTRASIVAAIGCTFGIVPHMLAAITGLAALLQASPLAFQILRYLGVGYLVYMAWNTLREKGGLTVDERTAPQSAGKVITTGILINILNPKLTIFFFAFLPQFVDPDEPNALLRMSGLSLIFMALTFLVFIGYGKFASAIRQHVVSRPSIMAWLRRTFAAAFIALAVRLALT